MFQLWCFQEMMGMCCTQTAPHTQTEGPITILFQRYIPQGRSLAHRKSYQLNTTIQDSGL
uniref:Uncharacterized protein n=1 Tax=Arundo donax TaxID=35708 RepID=A0A0A9CEX7_ARUDO